MAIRTSASPKVVNPGGRLYSVSLNLFLYGETHLLFAENAEDAVDKFLNHPKRKSNRIPSQLRRLMRMVAEVVPRCATTSKELALHILTTQRGKMSCRFHDIKRGTKGAKEVDRLGCIVGVAYTKFTGSAEPTAGFLHCGCDENAALWEFFWFKTWTIASQNPNIKSFEGMRPEANDVLNARQRAFFSQAYVVGTLLHIDDIYSANPAFGTDEYFVNLRMIQVNRMIYMLNQSLPKDSNWDYVVAKKDKTDGNGDVPMS